ncbi:MAG: HAD family hydrolase [Propioniciclava sp.]
MSASPVLLWDFDGTLADTHPLWRGAIAGVIGDRDGAIDEVTMRRALDSSSAGVVALIRDAIGAPLPAGELLEDLWGRVHRRVAVRTPWIPDARRLVVEAHQVGVRCGLVSNSPRMLLEAALASLPAGLFECVVAAEDVTAAKPDPAGYLQALAVMGVAAEQALALEDSRTGATAAIAAGVPVLHVGPTPLVDLPVAADIVSFAGVTVSDLLDLPGGELPPGR